MKLLQIVQTLLVLSFGSVAMAWKSPHTSNIAKFRGKQLSSLESPAQVLIDSNYNLAAGSAVVGTLFGVLENFKGRTAQIFGAGAIIFTLFGGFIAFQTSSLRFQFDDKSFSLVKVGGENIGDNIVVGGENSWRYEAFVNYAFLPNEEFPILVYFKETQTPVENRVDAPIVVDDLDGQAHFFPAISNVQSLKENFEYHKCAKIETASVKLQASNAVL